MLRAMGYFRLFRRIKIAPGVTINVSKSGLSTSFGPKGAKITVGKRGIRRTVGIPGTGMYYTSLSSPGQKSATPVIAPAAPSSVGAPTTWGIRSWVGVLVVVVILAAVVGSCLGGSSGGPVPTPPPPALGFTNQASRLGSTPAPTPTVFVSPSASSAPATKKPAASPKPITNPKPTARPTVRPTATPATKLSVKVTALTASVPAIAPRWCPSRRRPGLGARSSSSTSPALRRRPDSVTRQRVRPGPLAGRGRSEAARRAERGRYPSAASLEAVSGVSIPPSPSASRRAVR